MREFGLPRKGGAARRGRGYERWMNDVLRAWVCAKAAKMIRDEVRITREREAEAHKDGYATFIDENGELQYR